MNEIMASPDESRLERALSVIREALKDKVIDPFVVGDVIRWDSAGQYTYAAIKTPAGWFTTARPGNPYVPPSPMRFETLVEVLAESENQGIQVATGWESM